jgi:hypothetical protein
MKKLILSFFVLHFSFFFLNAQSYLSGDFFKGYIITNTQKDTVRCYVQNKNDFENSRVVKYKFFKEDAVQEFKIENVVELYDNTSVFKKINYKKRDYLFKQLVKGYVSLYEQVTTSISNDGSISKSNTYYLEKQDQLLRIRWTAYKDDLKSILTDDPETTQKIEDLKFLQVETFIQALVNNYNAKMGKK